MFTGERILNVCPRWLLDDPSRNGTENGRQQTLKKAQGSLHNGRDNTDHCEEQGLEEVQQTVNRKDPLDTEYYTISHSEGDAPEIPVRSFLIPLGVLLLIMIFLFGAYHNRARIHNKFFQTQEENEQDSTEPCEEQEKKTVNRIDDTYFYCE
ncbi:hypothetical protein NFI96_033203 [Prochilodus magdalenae]|nr:hypothetical protein NFI96_033203 [Prochilodus magdalenae]